MKTLISLIMISSMFNFLLFSQPSASNSKGNGIEGLPHQLKIDEEDKYILCEAEQIKVEADIWLKEAYGLSDNLYEIFNIIDVSAKYTDIRKKAIKKAEKTEFRIISKQVDALEYYELSNDILYAFYKKYHQRLFPEVDKASIHNGNQLMKEADGLWKEAKVLREKGYVEGLNRKAIDILILAQKKEEKAIENQETAFGLFMNTCWSFAMPIDYALLVPVKSRPESTNNQEILLANNNSVKNETLTENNIDLNTESQTVKNEEFKSVANVRYKIQVGAFKGKADETAFRGINPITVEKSEAGFTRYLAGEYQSYDVASHALEILKNTGFRDAFLVTYSNEVRLGPGIKIPNVYELAKK